MNRRRTNPYNMHPYLSRQQAQRLRREERPGPAEKQPEEKMPEAEDQISFENNGESAKPDAEMAQERSSEDDAAVQDKLEKLLEEKLKEERLRNAAEMDNFKKRLNRDHQEQIRYAAGKVLSDLLPALDNLDLALQYGSQHEACKDMMQGIEMTRKQLLEAVGKNGLVALGERGEAFDPAIHEAVGIFPDESLEKGAVSQVMQRGYKLNDRTLRPAKVMVNN